MLQIIRNLFLPSNRFRIPSPTKELPECDIRSLRDSDVETCERIYQLNESARFPPGYFPRFSDWLRNRRALILVAESGEVVRGVGGLTVGMQAEHYVAVLSFGMIHPSYQRQGLGTTLLLARLALLRPPTGMAVATMTNVGGSETFYRRFGFRQYHTSIEPAGNKFKHSAVRMLAADQDRCWKALQRVRMAPDLRDISIPDRPPADTLAPVAGASAST